MNHTCMGTLIQVDNKYYYRCLWDGEVVLVVNKTICTCPNCNRPILEEHRIPQIGKMICKKTIIENYVIDVVDGDCYDYERTVTNLS